MAARPFAQQLRPLSGCTARPLHGWRMLRGPGADADPGTPCSGRWGACWTLRIPSTARMSTTSVCGPRTEPAAMTFIHLPNGRPSLKHMARRCPWRLRRHKVRSSALPATTGQALSGHGQVLDPSLTYLLLSLAHRDDQPSTPSTWAWSPATPPPDGAASRGSISLLRQPRPRSHTTARRIVDWLPDDAVVQAPARLPAPLRPAPGWFEGRMLLGVHLPSPADAGVDRDWSIWPHAGAAPTGPALACIGPLETGSHNLLYLDNAKTGPARAGAGVADLKNTGGREPLISYRCGNRDSLLILAGGIRSSRAPSGVVSSPVPAGARARYRSNRLGSPRRHGLQWHDALPVPPRTCARP